MSDRNIRARDALRGEWLPGMSDVLGRTYLGDGRWADPSPTPCRPIDPPAPDLDDPVTALALLAVLRRRLGAPFAQVSPALDDGAFWVVYLNDGSDRSFRGPTEADALIAALEATC